MCRYGKTEQCRRCRMKATSKKSVELFEAVTLVQYLRGNKPPRDQNGKPIESQTHHVLCLWRKKIWSTLLIPAFFEQYIATVVVDKQHKQVTTID